MAGYRQPYVLIKRARKHGIVYYYRVAGEKTAHSTGKSNKGEAKEYVETVVLARTTGRITLGEYLEPYFDWNRCPHVRRLRTEGKSVSPSYARDQRSRIERFVLTDPIRDIPIGDLKRAHIIDFRERLFDPGREKPVGARTANCTMGALKTVLREAFYREDIDRDPTAGVGQIKYKEQEVGIFTVAEIRALFDEIPGVWQDLSCYVAFILAAQAGLRRGEILALVWGQIDFEQSFITIDRAMTDNGLPKWDRIRGTPISLRCRSALLELRRRSEFVLPHQLVVCGKDGKPRSEHWWRERFNIAMESAGLDRKGRNLRPHSFRHTLNTSLRAAGTDPALIRVSLGWSSEQVQERYTHWHPEHCAEQRRRLDELFG